MSLETYKLLHLVGLILVFLGVGGVLFGRRPDTGRAPRGATMLHGIGMLVMLVAGFGMLARLEMKFPWEGWVFAKLGVWIVLGALPTMIKKGALKGPLGWLAAAGLGALAAWLAIGKPF